jgi:hypothetical protein
MRTITQVCGSAVASVSNRCISSLTAPRATITKTRTPYTPALSVCFPPVIRRPASLAWLAAPHRSRG